MAIIEQQQQQKQQQQHQQRQIPRALLLGRPSPSKMTNSGKNKQTPDVVACVDSSTIMRLTNIAVPTNLDVLCGRGVATNRHIGNESFRALVKCHKETYVCSTKAAKMKMSRFIVQTIRAQRGRFLERDDSGLWMDIGDKKAIEKTSQALRDGAAPLRRLIAANAEKNKLCDIKSEDNTINIITKDPSNSINTKNTKKRDVCSTTKKAKLERKVTVDEKIERTVKVVGLNNVAKKDLVKKRKKRITKKTVVHKSKLDVPRLAPKMVSTDSCSPGFALEPLIAPKLTMPHRTITSIPTPLPQQQSFTNTAALIAAPISPSPNMKPKIGDNNSPFSPISPLLFSPDLAPHIVERNTGWNSSQKSLNETYDNDGAGHHHNRISPKTQPRARGSMYDYDCGIISPSSTMVPPPPSPRSAITSSLHNQLSVGVQLPENHHSSPCQPQNNRIPHHPHHHHISFPYAQSPAYLLMPMTQCPLSDREQQQQQQQHQQYQQQHHVVHDSHIATDVKLLPIRSSCLSHIQSSYAFYNDENRGGGENTKPDVVSSTPRPNRVESSFEEDISRSSSDDIDEMVDEFDDMAPLPYRSEDECSDWETEDKSSDDNSLGWDFPNGHHLKNRYLMNLIQSPLLE